MDEATDQTIGGQVSRTGSKRQPDSVRSADRAAFVAHPLRNG